MNGMVHEVNLPGLHFGFLFFSFWDGVGGGWGVILPYSVWLWCKPYTIIYDNTITKYPQYVVICCVHLHVEMIINIKSPLYIYIFYIYIYIYSRV